MTEDEMMLMNQIKQQNEDLKRKSDNSGGCGKSLIGIALIIVVLKFCVPDVLDYILYGDKGKPKTEQVEEESTEASNENYNRDNSIAIKYIHMQLPDESGNVSIEIQAINTSRKNISRVSFKLSFLDSNGRNVQNLLTGKMYENALMDGPIAPGQKFGDVWVNIYNNTNATSYVLSVVAIMYDDGSVITIDNTKDLTY